MLEHSLRRFKKDEVQSIIIPDGIGGLIEVERLVLLEQGLLVIECYPMNGHLFGSEHIDQWTQIIDGRSFKFPNPAHHIQNVKHAIQLLVPKMPIYSRIVFTADGDFPKGIPEGVSLLKTLEADLDTMISSVPIPELSQKAWERVLRIARKNGQAVMSDGS